MPATMQTAAPICIDVRRSPKRGTDTASTATTSMCEAAKAGPTGACSRSVIHIAKAPRYPATATYVHGEKAAAQSRPVCMAASLRDTCVVVSIAASAAKPRM